jgi:hypothetical protein
VIFRDQCRRRRDVGDAGMAVGRLRETCGDEKCLEA